MSNNGLPSSVRYVKNGPRSRWWAAAKNNGQIHGGWDDIPDELLLKKDLPAIEMLLRKAHGDKRGATQDFNQLHDLLNSPSQHVWVTFEDGFMWWCTDSAYVSNGGFGIAMNGVVLDPTNSFLFVADGTLRCIWQVDLSTNVATRLAGTGTLGDERRAPPLRVVLNVFVYPRLRPCCERVE